MGDLFILFYQSPITEEAFEELFNKQDVKLFIKFFKDYVINGPQYSCIIIDKNASHDHGNGSNHSNIMYEAGDT